MLAGEAALPAVIPGEQEYRTEYDFFRGLRIRLGQEKYWLGRTLQEFYDERLNVKSGGRPLKTAMCKVYKCREI